MDVDIFKHKPADFVSAVSVAVRNALMMALAYAFKKDGDTDIDFDAMFRRVKTFPDNFNRKNTEGDDYALIDIGTVDALKDIFAGNLLLRKILN